MRSAGTALDHDGRRWSRTHSGTLPLLPPQPSRRVSSGKDKDDGVVPPVDFSLDACIEYIGEDELVEVTPENIRMLKNPDRNTKKKSGK